MVKDPNGYAVQVSDTRMYRRITKARHKKIALQTVTIPQIITTMPTAINIFFVGSLEVSMAENGAVTMPPIKSPATTFQ